MFVSHRAILACNGNRGAVAAELRMENGYILLIVFFYMLHGASKSYSSIEHEALMEGLAWTNVFQ